MSAMVFTLRDKPEQRLDLSPLVLDRLADLTPPQIERIELQTTKLRCTVGDVFAFAPGDANDIRFDGGSDRFDGLGAEMGGGTIVVDGDAGAQAGRGMTGGTLAIAGSAGPWAGSGMKAGRLTIGKHAGDWLGGPLPGELAGMSGGIIEVKGNAGEEAGHRLRRGIIAIAGKAGDHAARSMIAGTLLIAGRTGKLPGYLMRRGTLVLGRMPASLPATFLDCGRCDLVFMRLLERSLRDAGIATGLSFDRPMRRYAGDAATLGRGEILITQS